MVGNRLVVVSALSGGLAVALGAFGAHGLASLPPDRLAVFETAALYHMYHSLALLLVGVASLVEVAGTSASESGRRRGMALASRLFLIGVVLFSGSLYALAVTGLGWLGAVAPLGGLAFIGGWLTLARAYWS